jgi:hypothetical protein
MPTNPQQPTIYGNRAFVFIVDLTQSDNDDETSQSRRRRRQPEVIDLTNEDTNRILGDITSAIRPNTNRRVRPRRNNTEEREANKEKSKFEFQYT